MIKTFSARVLLSTTTGLALPSVPFNQFHEAIEHLLGEPVWTHQLGRPEPWDRAREALIAQHPAFANVDGDTLTSACEVRRVPANWEHPRDEHGRYRPMFDCDFASAAAEWDDGEAQWRLGHHPDQAKYEAAKDCAYEDWEGTRPDSRYYMPAWPASERTHYQMYEETSEGTPISPVMETPEQLARWLVDNKASTFGRGSTASYAAWLRIAQGGWGGPSMVMQHGVLMSGVEALATTATQVGDDGVQFKQLPGTYEKHETADRKSVV